MKRKPFGARDNSTQAKVVALFPEKPVSPIMVAEGDDDTRLLARIALGDHVAFATLVRRHTARFFRVAYRYTTHRSESEDIVQDAFLKLWERPEMWQPGRNTAFTTWFHRIIVNQCLDFAKRKRPLQLLDDSWIEDARPTHEEELFENEKQQLLARQINNLPERQRTALHLCFYDGLSNKEAAAMMGVRLKALQALLMRAKYTLKEKLKFTAGGAEHV